MHCFAGQRTIKGRLKRRIQAGAGLLATGLAGTFLAGTAATAAPPLPGAIFTTLPGGAEVNYNIYASKDDVYLNGGPGPGAPDTAAGLPDGTYVFQVTDPSGKALLSTDAAQCREFTVAGGIITGVVNPPACAHATVASTVEVGGTTVQLMPYLDTPNNGGEYKAWATPLADFACSLTAVPTNCYKPGSNIYGFVPAASKTDNFKVKNVVPQEIDTRFLDSSGNYIDGLSIIHTDPLGATNIKWSYENLALDIHHEAHVEATEFGTHLIQIYNQPGCTVGQVTVLGSVVGSGPRTVSVKAPKTTSTYTLRVDIQCL